MSDKLSYDEIEKIFKDLGVLKKGHFLLTSGRHSSFYFEKFRIFENPFYTYKLCKHIIRNIKKEDIDIVCGPATGGMILAYQIGFLLEKPTVYLEKKNDSFVLIRGMEIPKNKNILLVDDVLTTGKSVFSSIDVIKKNNAKVAKIIVIIDRRKDDKIPYEILSLYKASGEDYSKDECIQCKNNIPLINPKTNQIIKK